MIPIFILDIVVSVFQDIEDPTVNEIRLSTSMISGVTYSCDVTDTRLFIRAE